MANEKFTVSLSLFPKPIFKMGCIIAVVISWSLWHSVPWAIVHGLLSWLYVIYYLCA